jgi:general secretion pathway protein B
MSYILDALKKSEEERRKDKEKTLFQNPARSRPQKRGALLLLLSVLCVILAVNAALMIIGPRWLRFSPPRPLERDVMPGERPSVAAVPDTAHPTVFKDSAVVKTDLAAGAGRSASEVGAPSDSNKDSYEKGHEERVPLTAGKDETQNPVRTFEWRPEAGRIYALHELPPSVRETLPSFEVSVFFYSDDPEARVVRINGISVKEGDELSSGLKVEEIRENSIIFRADDYRLRISPGQG